MVFQAVEDFDFKNNRGKILEKEKLTDNDFKICVLAFC